MSLQLLSLDGESGIEERVSGSLLLAAQCSDHCMRVFELDGGLGLRPVQQPIKASHSGSFPNSADASPLRPAREDEGEPQDGGEDTPPVPPPSPSLHLAPCM